MPRDYNLLLSDIAEAAEKIGRYLKGMTKKEFLADEKTADAVIRNLEIIGEVIGNFSFNEKQKHPNVDWQSIIGMRNVLVHEYFGVDLDIVWDTAKKDVPVLRKKIAAIQKGLQP